MSRARAGRTGRWTAALALALAAGAAWAGPPYVTDDPEPVPFRHWEVYLASMLAFDGGVAGTAPHVEVNYGADPELQLHLIVPGAISAPTGGPIRWGPGDLEVGAKYRFVEEGDLRPQIGTFPIATLPTGSSARGLGEGSPTVFLPIWLQKSFGPWTTYGGGGWRRLVGPQGRNAWFMGWQAQRSFGAIAPGAELFHQTGLRVGEAGTTRIGAGVIADLSAKLHLLLSARRAIGGAAAPDVYVALLATL